MEKNKIGRVSKRKLVKGCNQGQNVICLAILEHLEFKIISTMLILLTMVANNAFHCSMTSLL